MNRADLAIQPSLIAAELLRLPCSAAARADPNRMLLASMLVGQATGHGCLDRWLCLDGDDWYSIATDYFSGLSFRSSPPPPPSIPEWNDLHKLLLDARACKRESELWMIRIVATACSGANHLWQDLGLANRDELTLLMQCNFPELALANMGDMKWKKFLYRQFCARENIYFCPAPSCGVCSDYAKCFSPET